MKNLLKIMCVLLLLSGCANNSNQADDKKVYNVEIIKQLDHASLNEISDAIVKQLETIAKENDVVINVTVDSGQNDASVLKQIADTAIANKVDAIIPIATLAAQIATSSAAESKTPIIYAAISDPEAADLTEIDYVTGTSDGLNTPFVFEMIKHINPDIKKVGLLYSLSETNSKKPIEEAKKILETNNIEYVEAVGNNNEEIITAASVLISEGVEAIFTPTDNVVMAAEIAIAQLFADAGIPHYTGADSFVRNGAFATCGVNYTQLGEKTADICFNILENGFNNIDDYYLMESNIITYNIETAQAINLDGSKFKDIGEIVVEVTTTLD